MPVYDEWECTCGQKVKTNVYSCPKCKKERIDIELECSNADVKKEMEKSNT